MIAENLSVIREKIRIAAEVSGRKSEDITIVGVTKTRPIDDVKRVILLGVGHIGENRVQEAEGKIPSIEEKAEWHLIGHLQSNKAKTAARLFDWIDSLDSEKLAVLLSREALALNKTLKILVQFKIPQEETKYGISPDEIPGILKSVSALPNLEIKGLMMMGSLGVSIEKIREEFRTARKIFDDIKSEPSFSTYMIELSMGMSADYDIAVEEGSTMVRIGSALFE